MDDTLWVKIVWACFLLFVTAASINDVRRFRLPNWLMLAGLLVGLGLSVAWGGWEGAKSSLLGILAGAGPLFILFALRLWGAGDAKFLGAIGSFIGPQGAFEALAAGAIAGGILSAVYYSLPKPNEERLKQKIPYGVALAAGGIVAALHGGFAGGQG